MTRLTRLDIICGMQERDESHLPEISGKDAAIIYNPASGSKERRHQLEDAAKKLQSYGKRVEVFSTLEPGHATELALEAISKDYKIIFAAGGDGTLNETARALINSEVILGHIPFGTINIWANETGIPKNAVKAVELAISHSGSVQRMDTGKMNDHFFLLMAGVGADAEVLSRVQKPGVKKNGTGLPQYIKQAIKAVPGYKGVPAELTMDGETFPFSLFQIWFGNTQRLAYVVLRPEARADDGVLEVTIAYGDRFSQLILPGISAIIKRGKNTTHSVFTKGSQFTLDSKSPIRMHVDGEPLEKTDHVEVKVVPNSLNVLVPRKRRTLFNNPPQTI